MDFKKAFLIVLLFRLIRGVATSNYSLELKPKELGRLCETYYEQLRPLASVGICKKGGRIKVADVSGLLSTCLDSIEETTKLCCLN